MIVSHFCRFIVFPDPLNSCEWLQHSLSPWADQLVSPVGRANHKTPFFRGMTPKEAERAFHRLDLDFGAYTKIGIVQNPFRRMADLYDSLCLHDPIWRLKQRAGLEVPDFATWLHSGQPFSRRVLSGLQPRWHRLGAISTERWASGRIDAFVRAEFAQEDLRQAFRQMGIIPAVGFGGHQKQHRFAEMLRYDRNTMAIIHQRFAKDLRLYSGLTSELDMAA